MLASIRSVRRVGHSSGSRCDRRQAASCLDARLRWPRACMRETRTSLVPLSVFATESRTSTEGWISARSTPPREMTLVTSMPLPTRWRRRNSGPEAPSSRRLQLPPLWRGTREARTCPGGGACAVSCPKQRKAFRRRQPGPPAHARPAAAAGHRRACRRHRDVGARRAAIRRRRGGSP